MKKGLAILVGGCMLALSLTGCGGSGSSAAGGSSGSVATGSDGAKVFQVGVLQQMEHEALDAATQGFQDALTEALGDQVEITVQNAQNDSNTCTTIATSFVSSGVDLIMANATNALQAAAAATDTIPILGTSITEYGVALSLSDFNGTVGGNISGASGSAGCHAAGMVPGCRKGGLAVLLRRTQLPVPGGCCQS